MAMARSAGFVSVEYLDTEDQRAHFTARRQSSVETHPTSEFEIISFVNAMTHEAIFAARGDENIVVWFRASHSFGSRSEFVLHTGGVDFTAGTLTQSRLWIGRLVFVFRVGLRNRSLRLLELGDQGQRERDRNTGGRIELGGSASYWSKCFF